MLAEFKTYSPAFGDQIDKYLTQFEYDRWVGRWEIMWVDRYVGGEEEKVGR